MTCYAAHTDAQLRKLAPEDPEAKAELIRRGLMSDPAAVARSRELLKRSQAKSAGFDFFEYSERPRKWSAKTRVS